jgi:hypothetical protein
MFLEEFGEGRDWDIESIVAIMLTNSREIGGGGDSSGFLEVFEERLWFRIDGVSQGFK